MISWWLPVAQTILHAMIAPAMLGVVRSIGARLQGRRGPDPIQPYRDLCKLISIPSTVPESASIVFLATPAIVFSAALLLGSALPTFAVRDEPGLDLVLVIGLLTMPKLIGALASFDAGTPFGPMAGGRQLFIRALAEPALLVATYVLAISQGTTNLSLLAVARSNQAAVLNQPFLLPEPILPLAVLAMAYLLLAELGRFPFDNPATHLELTMIEEGTKLDYSGRALALMFWADAMRFNFGMSLVVYLLLPPSVHDPVTVLGLLTGLGAYLAKVGGVLVLLAWWETTRGKLRLRAIANPLLVATAVLLFVLVTLVVTATEITGGT